MSISAGLASHGMRPNETRKVRPRLGRPTSGGFTLVELLVVIAIIGILVALLLPAIQAAREAARRAKCQNNMKNVALAVLNYESSRKKYPPGFVSQPSNAETWGWAVFSLPNLEEQALYDRLRPTETMVQNIGSVSTSGNRNLTDALASAKAGNTTDLQALQTVLPVFRCPSDTTPDLVPCEGGWCNGSNPSLSPDTSDGDRWTRSFQGLGAPANFYPPASNYVGNKGMSDNGCTGSGSGTSGSPWVPNDSVCATNGVFYGNSKISTRNITDGTTKTFMIGERNRFCMAGTWLGGRNSVDGSENHSTLWTLAHVFEPLNSPHTLNYNTCTEGFASPHPGGGFFAFCDASVHFISDDIDFNTIGNSRTCSVKGNSACTATFGTAAIGVYQRLA
jgi:prepilin-type N-terminal cleavage/methylation domain-containing protein